MTDCTLDTPLARDEMGLLVQADVDRELGAAEAARLVAHLRGCASCAALHGRMAALSQRTRTEAPRFVAPPVLRAAVLARLAASPAARRGLAGPTLAGRGRLGAAFGAGLALAASVVLVPARGDLAGDIVAGHIRALQPGHLMDVPSTDRHTVKPWFDGRLDYAPPVPDLAEAGFPLTGGRLDYVGGRAVAALVYQRRQHVIDVYVWPAAGARAPDAGSRNGYHYVRWVADGVAGWAVSDLEAVELADFVRRWQAAR